MARGGAGRDAARAGRKRTDEPRVFEAKAGCLSGEVEFVADTTWQHSFIKGDGSNAPDWTIVNERWWRLLQERFDQAAQSAPGRCIITSPALGGSGDVLLNLRGASHLALDVIEQPERITDALDKI